MQLDIQPVPLLGQLSSTNLSDPQHHIVAGSFRALSLVLLAFSPFHRSLELVQTVSTLGPHQYLATNSLRDVVYATSWAEPPTLSSWTVQSRPSSWTLNLLNTVPIRATSSYISLPPPHTHIYSTGGPTGEVHRVDTLTGGFGEKVQEILFVPPDALDKTDKTRVALRYGTHAVEISARGHAFIPELGTNTIHMFSVDRASGHLTLLSMNESPRAGDGPRHVVISPDGNLLYSIAEHTNYIDIYTITDTKLEHRVSRSLLPSRLRRETHRFRGDTLRLSPPTETAPRPTHLFATTRGGVRGEIRGWLAVFALGDDGLFFGSDNAREGQEDDDDEIGVLRWETPTSGGRANAIELRAKDNSEGEGLWIVLTNDDDHAGSPAVLVLEWNPSGGGINVFAEWPTDRSTEPIPVEGASHAIWLD